MQGFLCPEAAAEELTSHRLAGWLTAPGYSIIYKHTHIACFSDQILSDSI
jgi:hypothetical protein